MGMGRGKREEGGGKREEGRCQGEADEEIANGDGSSHAELKATGEWIAG
jgi:hypothetical protein